MTFSIPPSASTEEEGPSVPWEILWDAVVVGAGPAGSFTARELARMGRRVLLLDRRPFPRRKVCGATLSPGVREVLARTGLEGLLPASGAIPLSILRLGGWGLRADLPLNGTMALSRAVLDEALAGAASHEGVHFVSGIRVALGSLHGDRRVLRLSGGGQEREVSARAVVAADGLASGLLSQAGVPSRLTPSGERPLIGLGGVFPRGVSDFQAGVIHMAVGEEGYVGMVRVEGGSLNVAAAIHRSFLKETGSPNAVIDSILSKGGWPPIPGPPDDGWSGTPELTRSPARPGSERLFAVGDASGYVEPFTGEGTLWALSGALLLAPIVARVESGWDPSLLGEWASSLRSLTIRSQRWCRVISWTLAHPPLARLALRVLGSHPRLALPVVRRVGASILSPT